MYAVRLSSPPAAAASAFVPSAGLVSAAGAWRPNMSVGPLPPSSSSLSAGWSSFGFVGSLTGGGLPFSSRGSAVQQEGRDAAEDSADDSSSEEEEDTPAAAAAAPLNKTTSKKPAVLSLPAKKKNKQQVSKPSSGGGASDPQRKNRLAPRDTQTVLDLLPSAIRPPVECDLRSCTLGELRRMAVDPATAPHGSFLTLVGVLHQALNVQSTTSRGGTSQLFQQRIQVGSHSFTLRREAMARASFMKRDNQGRILKGVLNPNDLREQDPAPLLMSAAEGVVLLNVSANLSKHLRTRAFPAQIRVRRGNEARPLAQVPYGAGEDAKGRICTLTLVYALSSSSAKAATDVSFEPCVNFCADGRITAGPHDVFPSEQPLPCGCREQEASDSVNVREWFSPVINGRIVDDGGAAEAAAEAKRYQLHVFQQGSKVKHAPVDNDGDAIEEAPAQAQPVVTRSSTLAIGAKQKKRSATVSVDVPTFPSSSPLPCVSVAAAAASSLSTPSRSKRARLSSSPVPSVATASALASIPSPVPMEAEQEEQTVGQYAAAAAAALSSPPPLSPSNSVSDLSSEADQESCRPVDGLPASPLRQQQRQASAAVAVAVAAASVAQPSLFIDLSAMHDDDALCSYSSPILSAAAVAPTLPSPIRSPSSPSFLQSARALSFDLSVVASPMIGPQNADSTQGTNDDSLLSPNMHGNHSSDSGVLSPLSSPPPPPQQQHADPFRVSDDDGTRMREAMQPMFEWNGAAAAFVNAFFA